MSLRSPSKGTGILFGTIILIMGIFSGSIKITFAGIFWIILAYLIGDE